MADRSGSFVKGALLGALAGAVAGVLLAPKSGVETRKDIEKVAKKWAEKAGDIYEEASMLVEEKIKALKEAGKRIDEKKYEGMISEIVAELKNDGKVTAEVAKKVSSQLKRDWTKVKKAWDGEYSDTK